MRVKIYFTFQAWPQTRAETMTCTISQDPACVLVPPGGQTENNTAGQYTRNKDFILNLCCYKQLKLKAL